MVIPNQKPNHTFNDPQPFKYRDLYKSKWILVSLILCSALNVFQYLLDPTSITIVGFFNIPIFTNVSPVISIGSSLITAVIISPIIEFEWNLFCKLAIKK